MKRRQIVIFDPYAIGSFGNGKLIIGLFQNLDASQFRLHLVVPRQDELVDQIRSDGGEATVLSPPAMLQQYGGALERLGLLGKIKGFFALASYYYSLFKLFLRLKPDVLQCHSLRAVLMSAPVARVLGIPVLWYIKGEVEARGLTRIAYHLVSKIIYQCEALKQCCHPDLIPRTKKNHIHILPNGIDFSGIESLTEEVLQHTKNDLAFPKDRVVLCYLGIISPRKGLRTFIDALIELKSENINFCAYLVGGHVLDEYESFEDELIQLVKQHEMEDKIRFTGYRKDALSILSHSDIYVFPSLAEGMPRSVIEAMALGKPVLASRVGGLPEMITEDQEGLLFEPGDTATLLGALRKILGDREMQIRMGKAGQKKANAEYRLERVVNRLESLYSDL